MSDIVRYQPEQIREMALQVVKSGLFPAIKTPEQAFTLMMLADAFGIHPMKVGLIFDILPGGKPSMKGEAMLAEFYARGGTVEWGKSDTTECNAVFYSPGVPKGYHARFTIEDAKRAQLTGKTNWQHYAADMLRWRCATRGIKATLPAAGLGLYPTEVAQDFTGATVAGDFEVVGDEAGAVVRGASTEAPAPPAIQSASDPSPTEEYLAEAKKRREEALERFANLAPEPEEPVEQKLEKIKAEAAKKFGRPKSVPEFCPKCNTAVLQFDASGGGQYWECHERNRERHILKAQEADDSTIRQATEGHYFKWAGKGKEA